MIRAVKRFHGINFIEEESRALHWVEEGELGDLIRPWKRIPVVLQSPALPSIIDDNGDQARLSSTRSCWEQESALRMEDQLVLESILDTLRYVFRLSICCPLNPRLQLVLELARAS